MKKIICFMICAMLLLLSYSCLADEYPDPILFRKAQWGSSFNEVQKALSGDVQIVKDDEKEYWYQIDDILFTGDGTKYYKGNIGFYASPNTTDGLKVAGYDVTSMYTYFVYATDSNGLLDTKNSAFVYATYKLQPKSREAAYDDLLKKLTSLYGDVDLHRTQNYAIAYEQNLWHGADGTMVSLVSEDYGGGGSYYIWIRYSFAGANDLIESSYKALELQEVRDAESNTDGL